MAPVAKSEQFELKWGILSTAAIAKSFTGDLLIKRTSDSGLDASVSHRIVALASRSVDSAQRFIKENLNDDKSIHALGSYAELYAHKDVDIIYIATPHSHHYENVRDALRAGKHVCVEKPATVNAKQWEALVKLAKEKKCFLMEAVWTRFFPLVYHYQDLIKQGVIGDVEHVWAEFGWQRDLYTEGAELARFTDPELASGSLLDAGPYPLLHVLMAIPHPFGEKPPADGPLPLPKISSSVTPMLSIVTGHKDSSTIIADESAFATLLFPRSNGRQIAAQISSSLVFNTSPDRTVVITGTKGRIIIPYPPYRPEVVIVESNDTVKASLAKEKPARTERRFDLPCFGMGYEQDECARCIRDGQLESERISWRETAATMGIFDEIRRQNNFVYPQSIEKVD